MGPGRASEGIPWSWSDGIAAVWLLNSSLSSRDGVKKEELGKACLKQTQTLLHPKERQN